jgi:hypothetical protein
MLIVTMQVLGLTPFSNCKLYYPAFVNSCIPCIKAHFHIVKCLIYYLKKYISVIQMSGTIWVSYFLKFTTFKSMR